MKGMVLKAKCEVPGATVICRTMSKGYRATAAVAPDKAPEVNVNKGLDCVEMLNLDASW